MRYSEVIAARTSRVVEVADVPPAAGEVQVRVLASGVCVSERPPWEHHDGGEPRRLGHELSGEIVAIGSGVYGWSAGDRVTGFGSPVFADLVNVSARSLLPTPANVPSWAALGEPLACVVEVLSRCAIAPGMRVAVVGLGFMGLGALQVAASRAPGRLVGVDPNPHTRALALELGAHDVCDPDEAKESLRQGFDVVVEFSGTAPGLALAGDLVTQHGVLCVAGYHHDGARELDVELWYRGVTIINGFTPQRWRVMAAMAEGLQLMSERRLTFEPLITHRVTLDDIDRGFGYFLHRPTDFVKAICTP